MLLPGHKKANKKIKLNNSIPKKIFDNNSLDNWIITSSKTLFKDKFWKEGDVAMYIYRASMTINGVKYYAKDYGKRAFRIDIK